MNHYDAVVVGGGHNGLVAACYLARAGRSVLVLERLPYPGGAAVSAEVFPGVAARLSRYSYLVSLLPDRIVTDLGLDIDIRSRPVASYTPIGAGGLLVERDPGIATEESFRALTGSDREYTSWRRFADELSTLADAIPPTLLEPLQSSEKLRAQVGGRLWERFIAEPLGRTIESTFADDTVRGVVLTDAVIGTFTHAHDPDLRQNRCFLYHVIGNGSGEWKVPVGGMGAVTAALVETAHKLGVTIRCDTEVTGIEADGADARVTCADGTSVSASYVLAGVAPHTLDRLRGRTPASPDPEGAQVKVNLVLTRLPRLRSGVDPRQAFAGTFHLDETYANLQAAYDEAAAGHMPTRLPAELYCHTLTDPSILDPELARRGWHTLTLFGLHMPARLFAEDNEAGRAEAVRRYLGALNSYLAEPIEDCLASVANGQPCVEAKTPYDIEAALGMPGGHIFHGDLAWPWASTPDEVGTWGVETDTPNLVVCGSGARRGGGVSGIGGHNAAHAVLALMAR